MRIYRFRFCPNCKSPFRQLSDRLIDCGSCGFHYYFSVSPTNALILENEKRKILLVRKKVPPKRGQWDLPGGFVDFKESAEASVVREIKEELGLAIQDFRYFRSYTGTVYHYKGFVYHPLCFVFIGKINQREVVKIKTGDDVSGFHLFSYEEIPWNDIAFPDVTNALKDYVGLPSLHNSKSAKKSKE